MNVSPPDLMKEWVETQTTTGRYANASDYVRHLIRKDQEGAAEDRSNVTMNPEIAPERVDLPEAAFPPYCPQNLSLFI
jgi:putative addiction module CopG family antidote